MVSDGGESCFFFMGGQGGAGGAQGFWLPADLAFSLLSCPHPPDPLPLRGRGRILLYFAGGSAPGTPATGWDAALVFPVESGFRRGGLPGWSPADLATVVPGGELAFFVARLPFYFSLLSCPHPPSPLPLRGRGRILLYFAGGSAPGTPATGWDAALAQLSVTRIESPSFCHRCKRF